MSKKQKLSLGSLKVQSFVTSLGPKESGKVKGGETYDTYCGQCQSVWPGCAPDTCACDTAETACQWYCPTFQIECTINPE